jgi:tetratricopeptide (TPR) repeat protein
MEAYARGTEHYNNARYESALAEFQVAASLHASPDFQYNLALCYEKLNKYEEAIRAYETYLRTKGDAPDRANVEDRIERLRQQQRAAESASEPQPVQDEPQPVPADAAPVASKPSKPLIIAGAVIMGVGAALALGGGIGFGIVARKRGRELDDIQSGGNPQDKTLDDARDIERAGKRAETMQFALAVTGGVITIAGAAMLAVGVHRQRKAARERTARIVPHIGPRFSGLGIHGSF